MRSRITRSVYKTLAAKQLQFSASLISLRKYRSRALNGGPLAEVGHDEPLQKGPQLVIKGGRRITARRRLVRTLNLSAINNDAN